MDTQLAWILSFCAPALLIYAARRLHSRVSRAVVFYVAFSVLFGCVHFLCYRHNPNLYQVKETEKSSSAEAELDVQKHLESDLTEISVLNALVMQMADSSGKVREALQFTLDHRRYPLRYPTIDIETWVRFTMVGPRRDQPVYNAIAEVDFVDNYRGISKDTNRYYSVALPDKDEVSIEEFEFAQRILAIREDYTNDLTALFQPGTTRARLFSLLDFFYFSFSIVGVGEVIPAGHLLRALVYVQIVCTFVIPIAIDEAKQKNVQSAPNTGIAPTTDEEHAHTP